MVEQEESNTNITAGVGNHHQPDIYYLSQVHLKTTTAKIIRGFPKKKKQKKSTQN